MGQTLQNVVGPHLKLRMGYAYNEATGSRSASHSAVDNQGKAVAETESS
jgi:hypothetical protein